MIEAAFQPDLALQPIRLNGASDEIAMSGAGV